MFDTNRIPIPWAQRWKWIRFQTLPVLFFVFCVILTGYLWNRHLGTTNAVGEVFAERFDLASQIDGMLMDLPNRRLELLTTVKAGEVVGLIDRIPIDAEITTLTEQVSMMKADVAATEEQFRLEQQDRQFKTISEARVRADSVTRDRLEIANRRAMIAADKASLQGLKDAYEALRAAPASAVLKQDLFKARREYETVVDRLQSNTKGLVEAEQEFKLCLERQKALQAVTPGGDLVKMLEPKHAAIAVQEALLAQSQEKLRHIEIKSPIDGIVAAIFFRPGQTVVHGAPLVTIAAEDAQFIVSYIRQGRQLSVNENMAVDIRLRKIPVQIVSSYVDKVGAQIEIVPPHQLRDPKIQEWGIPVRIPMPNLPLGITLQPGELVDIRLKPYPMSKPVTNTAKNDAG
jgi:multidrug resistance efflux pump